MESPAVHAFEQDHVPAGIHDRTGDRDPGLAGHVDGRRHDLLGALMGEALAFGDIHCRSPRREEHAWIVRQHVAAIKQFSS
jgi:hypothetical protein